MTMEKKNMKEKIYVIKNQDSFELEKYIWMWTMF